MYKLITNIKDIDDKKIKILFSNNEVIKIYSIDDKVDDDFQEIKMDGEYVSPAWIDIHAHAWIKLDPYGDLPDRIGLSQGVPILLDAGSAGLDNIDEFYNDVKDSKTDVYSLINLSKKGITDSGELNNLKDYSAVDEIGEALTKYPEFIKGMKIRISSSIAGDNGIDAIKQANAINTKFHFKTLMHIGNTPPTIRDVLSTINHNFVITHAYNGKQNGIFANYDIVKNIMDKNLTEGVILDVGHGSASFSYKAFEKAVKVDKIPHIISTDIYKSNREDGPVYSLSLVISKCYSLGMDFKDVINAITINPAKAFKISGLENGLRDGMKPQLTFFNKEISSLNIKDSDGEEREITKFIVPTKVLHRGEIYNVNKQNLWPMK